MLCRGLGCCRNFTGDIVFDARFGELVSLAAGHRDKQAEDFVSSLSAFVFHEDFRTIVLLCPMGYQRDCAARLALPSSLEDLLK